MNCPVKFLEAAFDTPEKNLACDEALLNLCARKGQGQILRFWESLHHFVVLGYTSRAKTEVYLDRCQRMHVPVLRRCTGGGTVVQGRGCLNYVLVLRRTETGPLQTIANTNEFVLNTHKHALTPVLGSEVEVAGTSDLAIGGRKFSGNAQRRTGDWILYHGTFLIGFDIQLIDQLLPLPPKQPEYRGGRSHREFLTNLKISSVLMKDAIRNAWHAEGVVQLELQEEIDRLVATRYARKEWVDRL